MECPIKHETVSLESMRNMAWDDVAWELRTDCVRVIWSEVSELDAWVVNAFSPRGAVLWDFGSYRAFRIAHARVRDEQLRSRLATVRNLATGSPEFVEFLFGAVTRYFGTTFTGGCSLEQYRSASRRHESYFVPCEARAEVRSYFDLQAAQQRERLVRSVGESVQLVVTDQSRQDSEPWWSLLCKPLQLVGSEELDDFAGCVAEERLDASTLPLATVGYPGDIDLALPLPSVDSATISKLIRLAHTRVKIAVESYSRLSLEGLLDQLRTPGWSDIRLKKVGEEFESMLLSRFANQSYLGMNPLAGKSTRT